MSPQEFVSIISSHRFSLSNEKELQKDIADVLMSLGVEFQREFRLSSEDIVDFMFKEGFVAEIKIKASKRSIYRQCKRYCSHEAVTGLVLVTATALGFPEEIDGKPCWIASLGRAWL